jgi:hypothetical protein
VDLRPPAGGTAVLAGPGGRVLVGDAAGREPDQDVDRAAGQPVGEGGGAVAGVEDEQRHRPAGRQAADGPHATLNTQAGCSLLFRAGHRGHLGLETAPPARAGGGHLLGEP